MHLPPTDDLGKNLLMSVTADSSRGQSTFSMGSVVSAVYSGGETIPWLNHFLVGEATNQAYCNVFSYAYDPDIKWNESLESRKCSPWLHEMGNIFFDVTLSGPLSRFRPYSLLSLIKKLKDVDDHVRHEYMPQNSHSRDKTGRNSEDMPNYAKVCMEYLKILPDAPSVSRRDVVQRLAHVNIEHTVTGVQRGLGRSDSDVLCNTPTQNGIRGLESSYNPELLLHIIFQDKL